VPITLITPHQRPNSGGVDAIQEFARRASGLTDVHVVVAKGEPTPIEGVHVHGPDVLASLALPDADALLIPADLRHAERLFGLPPDRGVPMLLFQGYGTPHDPVVAANLVLAPHALCTSSWLVDEAVRAGCTASLIRYGLDRTVFAPGPPTEERGALVAMMTHPLEWKGTADGLEALRLAKRDHAEIGVRLFGKIDPGFEDATFLASPNQPSEVAALMQECAVLVCPSWEEGFGLPGLEGIACGAALATTDTKGSRDYAFHGRTALVSSPRDPAALARSIVDLIRDPDLRGRLIDSGRKQIDAIYRDWDRATEALVAAVDEATRIVSTRRGPRLVTPRDETDGDDWDLVAAQSSHRREARRAKLMAQTAEAERKEVEAELGRRIAGASDARRRLRELQVELERARDEHEQADISRAAVEARATRLAARLAAAQERITELESAMRAAEKEQADIRDELQAARQSVAERERQLDAAVTAHRQGKTELQDVRQKYETELHDVRTAHHAELREAGETLKLELLEERRARARETQEGRDALEALNTELAGARSETQQARRNEAATREELNRLTAELELSSAQRRRLEAALARAQADAQIAEAERQAFERRTLELSALVERAAESGHARRGLRRAAPQAEGVTVVGEAQSHPESAFAATEARRSGQESSLALVHKLPSASDTWPALPAGEHEAQETFLSEYRELVTHMPPSADERDPLALPVPADLRGMLVGCTEEQGSRLPSVDVVVCVHNALEDVRLCLWSVLHKASRRFRLIVVNDGSDDATSELLARIAEENAAITLIHREDPPHGYTIAANLGLRASTSDYVVLLNSDTIVSYGWMERIVEYGERHQQVGILGPLSNAASHQSVPERRSAGEWATNPLPSWLTEDGMALMLEQAAPRTDTRLPFINGFCYAIKREVISSIGIFDEQSFPEGYAEENDFSQRARNAGYELAVVDDAYVFHAKSRSYGSVKGREIARRAYQTFLDKHGREEINQLVSKMEADTTLNPVRAAVGDAISSPAASESALAQQGNVRLSVAFVLPGLGDGGSGGSHSIYQEVRGLRRLGVPARIALQDRALGRARKAYDDADEVFETFTDADDLTERTADANVIIATHFKSVATVAAVRARRDDFLAAYYVQDYEPMFKFASRADNEEAAGSYTAIPDVLLFAKTHWLCNLVSRRHGVFVAKVEPSIDEAVYSASDAEVRPGPTRIAAMVRPRTPRRQPYSTVGVLERLLDELPGAVEVTTFGCREEDLKKLTNAPTIQRSHAGLLKRDQVAELLGRSDIFLDMSTYQAFGRTAIEAMACGCAAVVPRLGGVWDFAQDGQNLLAIDTFDRGAAFDAVAALVADPERLAALKAAGLQTASRYSILRAALSEYIVLRQAYQARFG
jgi:glycosyltransferase involved in cell wall biosynthesis/GT2 family glycosyltransferase